MGHKPKGGPQQDETVDGSIPTHPAPSVVKLNNGTLRLGTQVMKGADLFLSVKPDEMDRLTIPTATLEVTDMITGADQALVHGRLTLNQLKELQALIGQSIEAIEKEWQDVRPQ